MNDSTPWTWLKIDTGTCHSEGAVRLVGGETASEGRVQVCRSSVWRGVRNCGQTQLAATICKQLGYLRKGNGQLKCSVEIAVPGSNVYTHYLKS